MTNYCTKGGERHYKSLEPGLLTKFLSFDHVREVIPQDFIFPFS